MFKAMSDHFSPRVGFQFFILFFGPGFAQQILIVFLHGQIHSISIFEPTPISRGEGTIFGQDPLTARSPQRKPILVFLAQMHHITLIYMHFSVFLIWNDF